MAKATNNKVKTGSCMGENVLKILNRMQFKLYEEILKIQEKWKNRRQRVGTENSQKKYQRPKVY